MARSSTTLLREIADTRAPGVKKENPQTHQSSKSQQRSGSERTATRTPRQLCYRYAATPPPPISPPPKKPQANRLSVSSDGEHKTAPRSGRTASVRTRG